MSYTYKECEAKEYCHCYGITEYVDVTFKYRDSKGRKQPDEKVKVGLCKTHKEWLNKIHDNKPLEMRGEEARFALHDDLFQDFANNSTMYTLIYLEDMNDKMKEDTFYIINGRDVKNFRELLIAGDETKKNVYIREVGFFQRSIRLVSEQGTCAASGGYKFEEFVVEVADICTELPLEAMAHRLTAFFKPLPEGKEQRDIFKPVPEGKEQRDIFIPTLETEYTLEPIPKFIREHFAKKQQEENYDKFKNCIGFINGDIDPSIIDWRKIREASSHTERSLFDTVTKLTEALIKSDKDAVDALSSSGAISDDVLWMTYVYANHVLYASFDPNKSLCENTDLIDLFISQGLEKDLLVLAISGERLRMLTIKQRDHHDILNENLFVVQYLVPAFITGENIIYKNEHISLTPLEYWHDFNNTTEYIGGGFSMYRDNTETFEKNVVILAYLEKNTLVAA